MQDRRSGPQSAAKRGFNPIDVNLASRPTSSPWPPSPGQEKGEQKCGGHPHVPRQGLRPCNPFLLVADQNASSVVDLQWRRYLAHKDPAPLDQNTYHRPVLFACGGRPAIGCCFVLHFLRLYEWPCLAGMGPAWRNFCFAKTSVRFSFLLPPRPNLRFHTGKNAHKIEHMYPYHTISGVAGRGWSGKEGASGFSA